MTCLELLSEILLHTVGFKEIAFVLLVGSELHVQLLSQLLDDSLLCITAWLVGQGRLGR